MQRAIAIVLLLAACATTPAPTPTTPLSPPAGERVAEGRVRGDAEPPQPQRFDGFLPITWDEKDGKIYLEIPRLGEELIWQVSLAAGLGSNPVGLDRNQLGATHLVRFERVGPRVLMIEPNFGYRAISNDPQERRAVEESFATSILAGFKVEREVGSGVIVDATEFFLSDAHGVARRLREAQQGNYTLDRNRSAIYLPRTKAFPRNTEVEATLTFTTNDRPGGLVREVTPTPDVISVREHHSFVALPEPGYKPRRADPRVGALSIDFYDYASPFTTPITKRWVVRHRLEKQDPNAALSDPVKPIIYYVDSGVPEPIRSALVEGAAWWNAAYEAAGFRNAFQVKVLPPDADPLDVRYNVINWVHRSTRGWSYGASIVDPRTGEILKGHVLLGSLRIRQDVLLARGLIPQYRGVEPLIDDQRDAALSDLDPKTSPSIMALARIRQLSAHEVGHTIGLDHNMAASTYGGRASVMDYPAPLVKITNGSIDLSDAYGVGVGSYDVAAIKYMYEQFAPGANEEAELNRLARATPLFISDPHSRPVGGAHPLGSVWDNGADPVSMLKHELEVRRIAVEQFGLRSLGYGEPLASLEEKLLPLYLHHRYQLEAAAKSIGGVYYTYAVKDDAAPLGPRAVPAAQQREALNVVISTLDPKFLAIPERILAYIPPPAYATGNPNTEVFPRRTDPVFDPISAAMTSADLTVGALLDPARAARLARQNDFTFRDVTDALIGITLQQGAIPRATRTLIVTRLAGLAANVDADPEVRAEAADALRRLRDRLVLVNDERENAHRRVTRDDIQRFLTRPAEPWKPSAMPPIPPGPPI